MDKGSLFLIPTPLGKVPANQSIPEYNLTIIRSISFFAVEQIKTAAQFLIHCEHPIPEHEIEMVEISKRKDSSDYEIEIINQLLMGNDVGLLSEAGCPGVADPGSSLIRLAHHAGIKLVPLVGPASMILALMASGFNGQKFRFSGYLGRDHESRNKQLKQLEQDSLQFDQTELFMESPQRNLTLLRDAINALKNDTYLLVASQLTLPDELIISKTVADWQRMKLPEIDKKPTIFGIWGESIYKQDVNKKGSVKKVKRW